MFQHLENLQVRIDDRKPHHHAPTNLDSALQPHGTHDGLAPTVYEVEEVVLEVAAESKERKSGQLARFNRRLLTYVNEMRRGTSNPRLAHRRRFNLRGSADESLVLLLDGKTLDFVLNVSFVHAHRESRFSVFACCLSADCAVESCKLIIEFLERMNLFEISSIGLLANRMKVTST